MLYHSMEARLGIIGSLRTTPSAQYGSALSRHRWSLELKPRLGSVYTSALPNRHAALAVRCLARASEHAFLQLLRNIRFSFASSSQRRVIPFLLFPIPCHLPKPNSARQWARAEPHYPRHYPTGRPVACVPWWRRPPTRPATLPLSLCCGSSARQRGTPSGAIETFGR
jgi:hypothetical protein